MEAKLTTYFIMVLPTKGCEEIEVVLVVGVGAVKRWMMSGCAFSHDAALTLASGPSIPIEARR